MKVRLVTFALTALLVAAAGVTLAVRTLRALDGGASSALTTQAPSAADVQRLRASVSTPTFWFGDRAFGAELSVARKVKDPSAVRFVYGLRCTNGESGVQCARAGQVDTLHRRAQPGRALTVRRSCWRPYRAAWVLRCGEPFRLFTGDRIVEFFAPLHGDDLHSRPWSELAGHLERFDRAGVGSVPATVPFSCDELRRYPARQRRAVPAELRTGRCAWERPPG